MTFAGCGGGDDNNGGNQNNTVDKTCKTPNGFVDDAGPDQRVKTGVRVQLDGSKSRGADGQDPNSYRWTLTSPDGSSAKLSDANSAAPQFKTDQNGAYVVKLVIDGKNDCDKQTDSVKITAKPQGANSTPTAEAGDDQTVTVGDTVYLNGADSRDADGNALDYAWKFDSRPDGSGAKLSDEDRVTPTFKADTAGTYILTLRVGDGREASDPDKVRITAKKNNNVPVARAGASQNVKVGSTVQLDGSESSDPHNRLITYKWHFLSIPDKSKVELENRDTVRPDFQADEPGSYVASLVVDNGKQTSQPDTVIVVAEKKNSQPVANAGRDRNVTTGLLVRLNGTRSSDADGDRISYGWTLSAQPKNSQTALVNATSPTPSFTPDMEGRYVAQLVVNDGQEPSPPDSVVVSASGGNSTPVANAGEDQLVGPSSQVSLDGSASTDANDDALNYHWSLVSRPKGSSAKLDKKDTVKPSFEADKFGFYVVSLTVDDGKLDSAPDRVVVASTPDVDLFVDQSADGDDSDYELVVNGNNNGSENKISLEAGAKNALLNRFRLKSDGGDYTVRDITMSPSGEEAEIEPYFDHLNDGASLKDGEPHDFAIRLRSVPSNKGEYAVTLGFTLYPGGQTFTFNYTVNVKP